MVEQVGFLKAFKLFWLNYVNFNGRSTRSEYWFVILWISIIMLPLFIMGYLGLIILFGSIFEIFVSPHTSGIMMVLSMILLFLASILIFVIGVSIIIPFIALIVRRFHDTGRTMVMPIIFTVVAIIYNALSRGLGYLLLDESRFGFIFMIILNVIYIGLAIYVLVIALLPSEQKDNRYGKSPYR